MAIDKDKFDIIFKIILLCLIGYGIYTFACWQSACAAPTPQPSSTVGSSCCSK